MAAALKRRQDVTQARLRELFRYDPLTGLFTRLTSHSGYSAGRVLHGTRTNCEHRCLVVDGVQYFAHNLAWLYMTGQWAYPMVDHIDTNGHNNVWTNLREATQTQNNANMRKRLGTSSRFKGVTYVAKRRKWQAAIKYKEKYTFLGRFDTEEEAAAAYMTKAQAVFGEYARQI